MMRIVFSPVRRDDLLELERLGDQLLVNGVTHDFSNLAEGAERSIEEIGSDWFVGSVVRRDGMLHLSLILPHGSDAPPETLYPVPFEVQADGPIPVPAHSLPAKRPEAVAGDDEV